MAQELYGVKPGGGPATWPAGKEPHDPGSRHLSALFKGPRSGRRLTADLPGPTTIARSFARVLPQVMTDAADLIGQALRGSS